MNQGRFYAEFAPSPLGFPDAASAIRSVAQELGVSYSEIVRRVVIYSRLAVGAETRADAEDRPDYSFSGGGTTRAGIPALAGRKEG
jgi:hypothetical protein